MDYVNETVNFRGVLDHVGRSDYVGAYHSDAYGSTETKQAERQKVLDFIVGFYPDENYCVKLLSLPGIDWTFERMLLGERARSHFVGLEHSYSAFKRSRRAIPCLPGSQLTDHGHLQDRVFQFGRGDYFYSKALSRDKARNNTVRSNRILYMKSDAYATMLLTDYSATMQQKQEFNDRFYRRNAAWLDFTSQLCQSVETTIQNALMFMEPTTAPKPLVITIMNARDGITGVESRIARIMKIQPAFVYDSHWTYAGKNGTPMLTVCGHVV